MYRQELIQRLRIPPLGNPLKEAHEFRRKERREAHQRAREIALLTPKEPDKETDIVEIVKERIKESMSKMLPYGTKSNQKVFIKNTEIVKTEKERIKQSMPKMLPCGTESNQTEPGKETDIAEIVKQRIKESMSKMLPYGTKSNQTASIKDIQVVKTEKERIKESMSKILPCGTESNQACVEKHVKCKRLPLISRIGRSVRAFFKRRKARRNE